MLLHGYFPDEPRVAAEARAAVDAGFEVDVVALRRPGEAPIDTVAGVRLRRLPVEHRRGGGLLRMVHEYAAFTLRAAMQAARRSSRGGYDVVQVHNPPDFLMLAAIVPRIRGARVILDVHDLSSDMFAMRFEGRPGSRVADKALRALERAAGRAASLVLTVHEPYRAELAARGVPKDKIVVVMNSLDERLLPQPLEKREDSALTVFYHGTVTPHYGVDLIVDAVGQLRDRHPALQIQIYGEGDGIPELESRARALGIADRLAIGGYLPQEDVLREAQKASVGVVPNLPTRLNRFALSTKLLEYVALGIPVVSADLPTIRTHFTDEEVLYFRAGDASSLARALDEVASDPSAAAKRAMAARRRYEEYRWERSERTYVRVLRDLARRGAPTS